MTAIYKRELKSYFQSMTGYVLIAFLVIFTGIYFMAYNLNSGYPYFSYVLMNINYVLIIIIPMLTMRSFAEERKNKTDQLLLAAPVKLFDIVMGKYLAMVTVFAVPCLIFCIFPIIIKSFGTAYLKVDYLAILMFFLLGCVYLAIGMFLSSLTESQIIAAVTTFGVLLLIYLWGGLINFLPTSATSGMIGIVVLVTIAALIIYRMTGNWMIAGIIEAIGVVAVVIVSFVKSSLFENILVNIMKKLYLADVFDNVAYNKLFDVSGLILYLSVAGVFIFLTMKSQGSAKNEANNVAQTAAAAPAETAKVDFSNVKVEPLFEEEVDFDTFSKSDFRAVKVKECVAVPKSKKLLQFTLDDGTGTDRTILSGIHSYYEPEELVGKTLIAITNLPPRKMMGIESCGMLLSAVNNLKDSEDEELHLLMVDNHIPAGAKLY